MRKHVKIMKMVLMITMILMTTSGAFDENMRC